MSVKTSVSSTAQSLRTRPGMFVRTRSFACIDPAEGSPTLSGDSIITWSPGGGGVLLCSGTLLCLKASQRRCSARSAGNGAVTGLWWGLVVRNVLYPLPQARECPLAVAENDGLYPPGVLSLGLSLMPRDRLALAVYRPSSSPALKAASPAFRSL